MNTSQAGARQRLDVTMADGLRHRFSIDRVDEWPAQLRELIAHREVMRATAARVS